MSIRNRILLFAVLVTLLPSLGLGWIYFQQSEKTLLENVQQELKSTVSHVERELVLWLKERLYEMRVFSSSYLLSDALVDYYQPPSTEATPAAAEKSASVADMSSYLSLVRKQYQLYQQLLVFDNDGVLIAQDPVDDRAVALPDDWPKQINARQMIIGDFQAGQTGQDPVLLLGVPVSSGNDGVLGILGAEIRTRALVEMMQAVLAAGEKKHSGERLSLVDADGRVLLSTATSEELSPGSSLDLANLSHVSGQLSTYVRENGESMVGTLTKVAGYPWFVLMEKRRDALFADIERMRNFTLLTVLGLVSVIGLLAYWLARGIISPLRELTVAAGRVAEDDLDVRIPVRRKDELGLASRVFNDMVKQLKQSRERLEMLSTIDSLTGLPNRKAIMEEFAAVLARYRRHRRAFSVLLIDIDHFKTVNDQDGHLAGDEVLRHVATVLDDQVRKVDMVGRYGGEEFLALLDETDRETAMGVAERIRNAIAVSHVSYQGKLLKVTVSIGVAEISGPRETREQLMDRADKAMYTAKQQGRNRVMLAGVEAKGGNVVAYPSNN